MCEYHSFGYIFCSPREAAEHWKNEAGRLAGIEPSNMSAGFAGLSAGESQEMCEERAAVELGHVAREQHQEEYCCRCETLAAEEATHDECAAEAVRRGM